MSTVFNLNCYLRWTQVPKPNCLDDLMVTRWRPKWPWQPIGVQNGLFWFPFGSQEQIRSSSGHQGFWSPFGPGTCIHLTDFCETLISVSKMRLSGKTIVSLSISTLNVFGKTLTLILNSQKLSNSHSRLSTFNSQYFEKINIHSKKPKWSCTKYAFFCKAFKIIPSKIVATY